VVLVDVKEPHPDAAKYAEKFKFSFPVVLDSEGRVATTYAPSGVQPELARDQVPIASNLLIDRDGTIRFFDLLDSAHFDAKLEKLTAQLDKLLAAK